MWQKAYKASLSMQIVKSLFSTSWCIDNSMLYG